MSENKTGEPAAACTQTANTISQLLPSIVRGVKRANRGRGGRSFLEEQDLVQEFLLYLLRTDFKLLRRWAASGGASLQSYVGMAAQRRTVSVLRSARRSGCREIPCAEDSLPPDAHCSMEEQLLARDTIRRLGSHLSERSLHALVGDVAHASLAARQAEYEAVYRLRRRLRRAPVGRLLRHGGTP
jgi:hypothetical protein